MKNKLLYIIVGIVVIIIGGIFFFMNYIQNKDAHAFKKEYESLNGKLIEAKDDGSVHSTISIEKDNPIKYIKYNDLVNLIKNGTGIVYFGFPECPWCRTAIPVLLESAKEKNIDTIYYYNALSIRDIKHLDDNEKIIVDKEGTNEYYELVDLLKDCLTPYKGLNDNNIKRLYFPTIIFIKNGQIVGSHISTIDTQENAYIPLSDEQHAELKNIYNTYIKQTYPGTCDADHSC